MQLAISTGYLFINNTHLIWESLRKGTQTLGMYYARLRSSWEELSHYDSFIEWPASAPSEKVYIPPTATEIYAKIVEKTRVFQFIAGLIPTLRTLSAGGISCALSDVHSLGHLRYAMAHRISLPQFLMFCFCSIPCLSAFHC
ncbi:hypothetical protein GIB67_003421 [Kingdonia uniflora]|uniref:Uncharacterized protein n=1 Tax=Kingdonia uniflora TaxID=39325 RepID=A0A7J7P9C0_9MAGN|nr:hypothetical protein GIB67_003421 [Kingdonia uniflora]